MKVTSVSSFLVQNSIIILIGIVAYIIAMVTLNFALSVPMLLLGIVSPVAFIYLVNHPKVFIYFIIPYWPFGFMINKLFSFLPGGNEYLSVNLLGVLFVLGTVMGIVFLIKEKSPIFNYKLTIPMLLFFMPVIIGIIISPMKFWALRFLFRFGMPAIFYFLILEEIDLKEGQRLLKIFLISFIPVMIMSYYNIVTQGNIARYEGGLATGEAIYRLAFTGFHANTIGLYFPIYIMISMFLYFESKIRYRWIYLFLIVNMIILLFHTYSRAGWVCFVGGMFIITMLRSRKLFALFMLIGAFVLLASPFLTQRIESRWEEQGSIDSRMKRYEFAWKLFLESPVIGNGQGAFQLITAQQQRYTEYAHNEYGIGGAATHNEHLRILAENGILGEAVFLYLMFRFVKLAFQIFKLPYETAKNYSAFFLAIMVISLLYGIPGHGFQSTNLFVWTFAAIGEVMMREMTLQNAPLTDNQVVV